MADETMQGLTPEALHNALVATTIAYGAAMADLKRAIGALQMMLARANAEKEELRKLGAEQEKVVRELQRRLEQYAEG